jgi:hypothetical protein
VDAHNYKICHANEGPEDLNVGESSLATASGEAYGKNYQGSRNQVKHTPRGLVTAAGCNCKCPAGTVDLRCLRRQMPGMTLTNLQVQHLSLYGCRRAREIQLAWVLMPKSCVFSTATRVDIPMRLCSAPYSPMFVRLGLRICSVSRQGRVCYNERILV